MSGKRRIQPNADLAAPKRSASAADIAQRIQRMAVFVRGVAGLPMAPTLPKPMKSIAVEQSPGWWVLAQGRLLDPEDFDTREAAREDLLAAVLRAGVLVAENVWVWDETGRAQLVLATLPTLERARRVAERLREKGLNITVRREMPPAD